MIKLNNCNCESCIEKNNFDKDIGIIIQGPYQNSNIFEYIVNAYSGINNVIFILHKNEIELEQKSKMLLDHNSINYAICDTPSNSGYQNVNVQAASVMTGLNILENLGYKKAIKIRSDMVLYPLHTLLNNLEWDKLNFFEYVRVGYHIDRKNTNEKIIKKYKDNINYKPAYPTDYIVAGKINDMKMYFDYYEQEYENWAAEYKFIFNYLYRKNLMLDNSIDYLKNYCNFFRRTLKEKEIDMVWITREWRNLAIDF